MADSDVSLVITSCGRQDLLERTLASFIAHNTYPISQTIIIEDGPAERNALLRQKFGDKSFTWLETGRRVGQIAAIDEAYQHVESPLIFHCEDDWEFHAPGFIEKSLTILERRPEILHVSVRALGDTNGYPVLQEKFFEEGIPFFFAADSFHTPATGVWHGFSFNPSLRRMKEYRLLGSFSNLDPDRNKQAWEVERAASVFFYERGFRAAIIADNEGRGYVRHIGQDRQVAPP